MDFDEDSCSREPADPEAGSGNEDDALMEEIEALSETEVRRRLLERGIRAEEALARIRERLGKSLHENGD